MTNNMEIVFGIIALSFFSCAQHAKDAQVTIPTIHEGRGLNNIVVGRVNRDSLKYILSIPYDSVVYGRYSIAIHYPQLGAYFYYLRDDVSKEIFSMSFDTIFTGLTSKGFDIHKMTAADMIKIYGKPRWQMLESAKMLFAHYDSLGIYFAVTPNNIPEPDFYANVTEDDPVGDSLAQQKEQEYYSRIYAPSGIVEIIIGVPGTNF